jgi:DNA-binding IclR family transcriptional regulator
MEDGPYVRSVLKALRILDIFGFDDPTGAGFSLSELAARTGLAPNTLCKILKTLVRADYLTQDRAHRYHSSHKTSLIQMVAVPQHEASDQIEAIIRALSQEIAASVSLTTLSFGERKTVLQTTDGARRGRLVHNDASTGTFIYTKPTGRILVSYANSSQLHDILTRWGLPEQLWDEIGDLPRLNSAREAIRQQGACILHEQSDLTAIAVPVKVERCNFLGALGAAITIRSDHSRQEARLVEQLQLCAGEIAAVLA